MKKLFATVLFSLVFSGSAHAYLWSEAIPKEVHIIPHGLVLLGEFDNSGIICATGPKGIFLPKSDVNFKEKLTLALTAKATKKKIRVLINDPIETNCIQIPTLGFVPVVFHYYWQLKD